MTVDQYLKTIKGEKLARIEWLRASILKIAPEADESFSYGMPAYKLFKKPFVYFAVYDKHLRLYATPNTHEAFKLQLADYKQGKGSVQFPWDDPLPKKLILDMLKFRCDVLNEEYNPFSSLSKPAQRALLNAGIRELRDLKKLKKEVIVQLHGMGPKAIEELMKMMKKSKISFAK